MMQVISPEQTLANAMANSFRNFHTVGLDYVCLHRSTDLTVKGYFYDRTEVSARLVNPHSHRYDFATEVLRGSVINETWSEYVTADVSRSVHSSCGTNSNSIHR